jgi:aminoglycoside phosphotransferase
MSAGSVGKRALNHIYVTRNQERAGPFLGADAVHKLYSTCGIDIDDNTPAVFTHNDLCPPNILLPRGSNPKVVGIIDFGQSGWYPSYWEYCKARRAGVVDDQFDFALAEEWSTKDLPQIIDAVDDERFQYPSLYFMLADI